MRTFIFAVLFLAIPAVLLAGDGVDGLTRESNRSWMFEIASVNIGSVTHVDFTTNAVSVDGLKVTWSTPLRGNQSTCAMNTSTDDDLLIYFIPKGESVTVSHLTTPADGALTPVHRLYGTLNTDEKPHGYCERGLFDGVLLQSVGTDPAGVIGVVKN